MKTSADVEELRREADRPAYPVENESFGVSLREHFAVQILNGLLAKYGTPNLRDDGPYRRDAEGEAEHKDEEMSAYMKQLRAHHDVLTAKNRRAICLEAVALAYELVDVLNRTA